MQQLHYIPFSVAHLWCSTEVEHSLGITHLEDSLENSVNVVLFKSLWSFQIWNISSKMFLVGSLFVMIGSNVTKKCLEKTLSFIQVANYIFRKILSKCLKCVPIFGKIEIVFGKSRDWNLQKWRFGINLVLITWKPIPWYYCSYVFCFILIIKLVA